MKLPEPEVNYNRGPKGIDIAVVFVDLLSLSFWDLWCLLIVREKFFGNFKSVRLHFEKELKNKSFWNLHKRDQVRDLHHLLEDLEVRVRGFGGVSVLDMVPERLIKKEMPKAKSQILEVSCTHSPSDEMLKAPYRMLRKKAYRGQWENLPVNPIQFESQFISLFTPKAKFGYVPKGATFKLAWRFEKKVNKALEKIDKNSEARAHRYALHRCLLSLYQEENCWDDSYGNLGDLGQVWMKAVLSETPRSLPCGAAIFLKDLLMYCCWEDYGLVSTDQVVSYINSSLSPQERELAVTILEDISNRATAAFCNYSADTAFRLLEKVGSNTPGVDKKTPHLQIVDAEARD